MDEELANKTEEVKLKASTDESSLEIEIALPNLGNDLKIIEQIGEGGMGKVYKVLDKRIDKEVAVKVLTSSLANDKAALKRFEQEAEAAIGLEHPNLGTTYEHGRTEEGEPYIVLDYYEGKSLSEIIKEEGALKPTRAINLLEQIAQGLRYAHKQGVIHRDLKPTNIIVSPSEEGGEIARIVDFGIAKVMPKENRETHNLTETGEVFGSPNYMSPEQCLGFMLDSRSDIYSLGCLMYEILTGDPPYSGSNPIQVVVKHINEEIKPFSGELASNKTNKHLESIVFRCLEKDQINRYQKVEELLTDLSLIKDGKAPQKYKRQVKQKREFTKRQLIGSIVGISALVFYGCVSAAFFKQEYVLYILLFGVLNLLVGGGLYVAFTSLSEHCQKIEKLKHTSTGWWLAALSFFFGIICLTVLPYSTLGAIYILVRDMWHVYAFEWPKWMALPSMLAVVLNILAVLGAFVSGVGAGVFKGKGKIWVGKFLAQFVGLATSLVILSVFVFPKQVSQLFYTVAEVSRVHVPEAGRVFADLAYKLNSTDSRTAYLLAEAEIKAKNYDRAFSILNNKKAISQNDYRAMKMKVRIYSLQGKFQESLLLVSKYIDQIGEESEYSRSQAYNLKGSLYEMKKDFQSAYLAYSKAAEKKNPSKSVRINKLRMMCALGRYKEALKEIGSSEKGYNDSRFEFLEALIKEKLGDVKGARVSYQANAGKYEYWHDWNFSTSVNLAQVTKFGSYRALMNEYAYVKIGNKQRADYFSDKAKPMTRDDFGAIDLFENTGLSPNWQPLNNE